MEKIFELLKLNIKNYKKNYIKLIILNSLIFLLISIILIYGCSLNLVLEQEDAKNLTCNKVTILGNKDLKNNKEFFDKLNKLENVNEVSFTASKILFYENLNVNIDSKNFKKDNTFYSFYYLNKIPKAYLNEFKIRNKNEKFIKYGKMYTNKNEFVCTENFFWYLGITDIENQIGKNFNIKIDDTQYLNAKLVGVVNEKFRELSIKKDDFFPTIYLNTDNIVSKDVNTAILVDIYFDSYFLRDSMAEQIKEMLPEGNDLVALSDATIMKNLEGQRKIAFNIIMTVGILFIVLIIANMLYTYNKLLHDNFETNKIMVSNGLSKNELFKYALMQSVFISIIALIISILLSIAVLYIINSIIASIVNINMPINWNFYGIAIGIETLISIVLPFVYSLYAKNKK